MGRKIINIINSRSLKCNPVVIMLMVVVIFLSSSYGQSIPEHFINSQSLSEGLEAPLRLAVSSSGSIYTSDAFRKTILKYDAAGNFIEEISIPGKPVSLAVNKKGELFIGDGVSGKIFRYWKNKATIFYSGTSYPNSLVFSADNLLYVTDSEQKKVLVLDVSANLVRTIGEEDLIFPTGIAVDDANKHVFIAEHGGSGTGFSPTVKIMMYDTEGNFIKSFGSHGNTDGKFYRIQGMIIGRCGNLYAVDPYLGRISVFDNQGVFITSFGEWGGQEGQLNLPMDVDFDTQGNVLISSTNNRGIEIFEINDSLPSARISAGYEMICSGETSDIEIEFTGSAPWTFSYTIDGIYANTISTSENPYILSVMESGLYEITDLTDANFPGTCFTGSVEVLVNNTEPTAEISGDATICGGEAADVSIAFTGSAPWTFTYTTDGQNPETVTTVNNPHILKIQEAGRIEVTSLEGGGCAGTEINGSARISVLGQPSASILNQSRYFEIDPKDNIDIKIELSGIPPWSITYVRNEKDSVKIHDITSRQYTLSVSYPGNYEIAEVSDLYCSKKIEQENWEIALLPGIIMPSSYMNDEEIFLCEGDIAPIFVKFTGIGPWTFTYEVDTFMTTTIYNTYTNPYIISATLPGTYKITTLSDINYDGIDLTGSNFVTLMEPPEPEFSFTTSGLNVNFTNHSVNAESYVWDFGDGNTSTEINPSHDYDSPGEYLATLTASNGKCRDRHISMSINVITSSSETMDYNKNIRVYPNPSSGLLSVEISTQLTKEISLQVINMQGQILYQNKYFSQNISEQLNLSRYPDGIYMVKIFSEDFFEVNKVILNK